MLILRSRMEKGHLLALEIKDDWVAVNIFGSL